MTSPISAVVLAAGQRTHLGRDKALLEVDGEPAWRRQRSVLASAGAGEIFLSARPNQSWATRAEGFTDVLYDALPLCGPLVGVTAALERASHPWVMVLAVDLPAVTPDWFVALWRECTPGVGVVGRWEGRCEPLAAIYPREFRFLAWEGIVRQEFSLPRLLTEAVARGLMRVREVTAGDSQLLAGWSLPADASAEGTPAAGQA